MTSMAGEKSGRTFMRPLFFVSVEADYFIRSIFLAALKPFTSMR